MGDVHSSARGWFRSTLLHSLFPASANGSYNLSLLLHVDSCRGSAINESLCSPVQEVSSVVPGFLGVAGEVHP